MKYFARCAYDATTGIAWVDRTGKTWLWTGQYGFAMASLNGGALEQLGQCTIPAGTPPGEVAATCSQQIRARMTVDEGRWVSSCLLAHVNLHGMHQYISLRGNPPNPEAKAALSVTTNEAVFLPQPFGLLFADLHAESPFKGACVIGSVDNWSQAKTDLVLGRDCDVRPCSYPDPASTTTPPATIKLVRHFAGCWDGPNHYGDPPILDFSPSNAVSDFPLVDGVQVRDVPGPLRPLKTYGPAYQQAVPDALPILAADGHTVLAWKAKKFGFADVARCAKDPRFLEAGQNFCAAADSPFDGRFDVAQVIECGVGKCLGGNPFTSGGGYSADARTFAMVDMVSNQATDWSGGGRGADVSEPVTALIRYSKDRTASARVFVSNTDGEWSDVTTWNGEQGRLDGGAGGADIWPATEAGTWDYLQIYPVYIRTSPYVGFSFGRSCTASAECAAGLGLTCSSGMCVKKATATVDASGQTSWSCDGAPGQLQVYERSPDPYWSGNPTCVEQCTADAQCQTGDSCRSGRCSSPVARVRVAGAAVSESCTGPVRFKGPNETGACSYPFKALALKTNTVCPKEYEDGTPCRGALVWGKRQNVTGWFCRGGGEALYDCLPQDAPDLDAVGFVPGKPWCAPADAKAFVGMCK